MTNHFNSICNWPKLTFLSGSMPDSLTFVLKEQCIDEIILSRSLVTRERQYRDIQHAVSSNGRPIRIMESSLTLDDLNCMKYFEKKNFLGIWWRSFN